MCEPTTILTIASAVVSTASSVMSGIGASQQANYAAQVNDQNAKLANEQAKDSIQNTNLEAQRRYRQLAQTQGRQQAAMAANGIDLNFGSPVNVQKDTAAIGAEDVGQIYKAGFQQTHGHDISAWNYGSQAAADRAKAKGAMLQGIMGGLSSALGGATQLGKDGVFDKGTPGGGLSKLSSSTSKAPSGIPHF
jgi:hypothetical protein